MIFLNELSTLCASYLQEEYNLEVKAEDIIISQTKPEFEGDYTIVLFPFIKKTGKSPQLLGESIGNYIMEQSDIVSSYNIVKGFLNLSLSDRFWTQALSSIKTQEKEQNETDKPRVLVEYSSPNTNKPLHLGHIRNILLGWSTSKILEKAGYEVIRTQIVNDRGIAICKSMLAWEKYGNGETPENSHTKGDALVGKYYVLFETKFKEEYQTWQETKVAAEVYDNKKKDEESQGDFLKRYKNTYFNEYSALGKEVKQMLIAWEENDPHVRSLWEDMNSWVYKGFEETYNKLGVGFDKSYYESQTYLGGKEIVEEGLRRHIFYKEEDNSIWIDLEEQKLDKKIILRSDGTSVYLTQDLGTAEMRYQDFDAERMIYVVADEQDYHFKVLFETMKKLNRPYSEGMYHLSYGMVDLPTGKMKSREGTVVDADDLIAEVIAAAKEGAESRGGLEDLDAEERQSIYEAIGLGALKYFILKVNPKKRMVFQPEESLDMQGQTGPYIQNAYVRIQSILAKASEEEWQDKDTDYVPSEQEKTILKTLLDYDPTVSEAANQYDPSIIANYCYQLAKQYHKFYHDHRVLTAETEAAKIFRLQLSKEVGEVLKDGFELLGIKMPSRM